MNKHQLYLNIYQITGNADGNATIDCPPEDLARMLAVHVARNSGGEISYITMEFTGVRSRFLCSLLFDGTGDQGTGLMNFSMPKVKLNNRQKALVLLSCLELLIDQKILHASMDYFKERISNEYGNGQVAILGQYDVRNALSIEYINARQNGIPGVTHAHVPEAQLFTI